MDLNTQNKKIELIQWLTTLEDSSIIEELLNLRSKRSKDWWDDTCEAEKLSIYKGIEEADQKKLKPNTEAKKIYGKWL